MKKTERYHKAQEEFWVEESIERANDPYYPLSLGNEYVDEGFSDDNDKSKKIIQMMISLLGLMMFTVLITTNWIHILLVTPLLMLLLLGKKKMSLLATTQTSLATLKSTSSLPFLLKKKQFTKHM